MTEINKFFNNIVVADVETTGVTDDSDIIELSMSYPTGIDNQLDDIANFTSRFNPTHPVPPDASAIHYITTNELINEPDYKSMAITITELFSQKTYYVGHNVQFDRRMLIENHNRSDCSSVIFENDDSWICTLKLAKKLFAEDPEFKNLTLSYLWFKFELYKDSNVKISPHSAKDDVYMCYKVLAHLLNIAVERGMVDPSKEIGRQLTDITNSPTLYKAVPIGKYKGTVMEEVPMDYIVWMLANSDMLNENMPNFDADLAATFVNQLMTRNAEFSQD